MSEVDRYGAVDHTADNDANLSRLISKGDFSGYHLTRARDFMAKGNFKDAEYQCRAALSHDPGNADAKSLRAEAKSKMKG